MDMATNSDQVKVIAVGTHFYLQRYLYAFATQAEVSHHIRTQALQEETLRLTQILTAWESLQTRVESLIQTEVGLAEKVTLDPIPPEHQTDLDTIAADDLFRKTFSNIPISFRLVATDTLVAAQRTVNLDYVDRLLQRFPPNPSMKELVDICLSPKRQMDPIQHLEVGLNTHVFSSPNSDIRFLGAFVKDLASDDLKYAVGGGLPAAAIIAFVGYGGSPVNVFHANGRVVLNNGFHRVFALRSIGVRRIPVVVQNVRNIQLEFPAQVVGLPGQYLLHHPRPVLLKDFFETEFAITLKVKDRIKMVTVGIGLNQHEVPS